MGLPGLLATLIIPLAPIAAGLDAQQTAEFLLSFPQQDYIDPDWSQLLKIPLALGRGFTGLLDTAGIERLYDDRLGRITVGELPIPFYANIWDMDHNLLLYLGTRPPAGNWRHCQCRSSGSMFPRGMEIRV